MSMMCVACNVPQEALHRDLYKCHSCSLISSRYKSDIFMYDEFYKKRYEEYKDDEVGKELLELRKADVLRHMDTGHLLDYGCANGEFHQSFDDPIKGHGYDINACYGFSDINAVRSLNIRTMTLWDCIEHLDDPISVIMSFGPKVLIVSTPCIDDYKGRDIGQWRHYRPHEHVHIFGEESLAHLYGVMGYKVKEVHFKESTIRKSGGPKNIITMVGEKHERGGN